MLGDTAVAQQLGPFLDSEFVWLGSMPGCTSAPRGASEVSKAWGWCHQEKVAESAGLRVDMPDPFPPLSRALGQGGPQAGQAEGWGPWVGWECCPGWLRGHPLSWAFAESQPQASFRTTAPVRWRSPAAHTGPGVGTCPLPTRATGPALVTRFPRPLHRGQVSEVPSPWPPARWGVFASWLWDPKSLGTATPPHGLGHPPPSTSTPTPVPGRLVPQVLTCYRGCDKLVMAFVMVSPQLPNIYLPRVEVGAQD